MAIVIRVHVNSKSNKDGGHGMVQNPEGIMRIHNSQNKTIQWPKEKEQHDMLLSRRQYTENETKNTTKTQCIRMPRKGRHFLSH